MSKNRICQENNYEDLKDVLKIKPSKSVLLGFLKKNFKGNNFQNFIIFASKPIKPKKSKNGLKISKTFTKFFFVKKYMSS